MNGSLLTILLKAQQQHISMEDRGTLKRGFDSGGWIGVDVCVYVDPRVCV